MNKFPNILVLGGIVLFGIFVLSLIMRNYAHWRQQRDLPQSGDEAVVVDKRIKEEFFSDSDRKKPNSEHFITFQFAVSRERLEMRVSASDYAALNEGDQGILWHHGILFSRFDRR